jgi:hypothetical protein
METAEADIPVRPYDDELPVDPQLAADFPLPDPRS